MFDKRIKKPFHKPSIRFVMLMICSTELNGHQPELRHSYDYVFINSNLIFHFHRQIYQVWVKHCQRYVVPECQVQQIFLDLNLFPTKEQGK
jgi:hypothetical protein